MKFPLTCSQEKVDNQDLTDQMEILDQMRKKEQMGRVDLMKWLTSKNQMKNLISDSQNDAFLIFVC